MEASHISIEQRWGFLGPWCQALAHKVQYARLRCEGADEGGWERRERQLQVALGPQRHPQDAYEPSELVRVREALALLAAVAYVDHAAWKYLLLAHCKLNWWREGEENLPERLPAQFVLKLPQDKVAEELVKFCGVGHREQPSAAYVEAMKRVAALDRRLQLSSPGVDVQVPVRVAYGVAEENLAGPGQQEQLLKGMRKLPRAERVIRQEWERLQRTDVEAGAIRCTFVLEPLIADIQESGSVAKTAAMMERYVLNNFWFSLVSVKAKLSSESDEPDTLIAFRQLMIALFDGARRDPAAAHTRYYGNAAQRSQLQLGKLVLHADGALDTLETEALFSSAVLNQTTQRLTAWMSLLSHEHDRTNICRGLVDMQFKFDQFRAPTHGISTFRPHWENVAALAASLAKENNPLVKCISELRIRLVMSSETDDRAYESNAVRMGLGALLKMLAVNKYLQYLEVKVSSEHTDYLDSFRRHHQQVIGHSLNLESKIAFLSVLPNPRNPLEAPAKKKCATPASRRQLSNLGQTALSLIFAYAAEPVTRRVCFRAF
ncbi:uncharacterized protein IUM83_08967 [Phytophthora cinnamomi]|uniref:uncharacterized protein n=1 Tax=Phytophthora cinnamomi TaxID=4785 RepID=UPI00355A2DAD|nr:hypothetical protein IUM83_08967 [Phytophthora cinnamomi]